jgi:2,3-bisphosphoglycerate-dependent phosphoglycerate mutase
MPSILLIRHCQSTSQAAEGTLSETGTRDAVALAERLLDFAPDAIYASPYRRAVDTITPLAKRARLTIREDARLRERELAAGDDWLEHVRRSYDDPSYKLRGGESLDEACARARAALVDIAAAAHRLPVVVSHGNLISAILRSVEPGFGFEAWRSMRNPDLYVLAHEDGRPAAFTHLDLAALGVVHA